MRSMGVAAMVAAVTVCALASLASATALRVEPVLLELNAPTAAGVLTMHNQEDTAVDVQTRVFRWSQTAGRESLDPTTDVVASPPIVKLAPHTDYTVRVVRTSGQPLRGEESYRVIVDELPGPQRQTQSSIAILIRQSIPVFFRAARLSGAKVTWSLARERDAIVVTASNIGDEHLRIAALRLRDAAGKTVGFGNGLVGYVLGRSSMNFVVMRPPPGFASRGPVLITAVSNKGPINGTALLQSQR